jgi:hypothetical protein
LNATHDRRIVAAAEGPIRHALEELRIVPAEHRPFVVVEEPLLSLIVQFTGSTHAPLCLDAPFVALSPSRRANLARVLERATLADKPHIAERGEWSWIVRGVSPAEGARLALVLFRDAFGLPDDATVTIARETTRPRHGRS